MFDARALREFCSKFSYGDALAQRLLAGLHNPLRQVRPSAANTTGGIFDPGSQQVIAIESRSVEMRFALHCRFSLDCLAFLDQAFELDIRYANPGGRRIRTRTIVDFLHFDKHRGAVLTSCKPTAAAAKLIAKAPGRYVVGNNGRLRDLAAEEEARRLGLPFQMFLDSDVSEARFGNYLYFKDYVERIDPPPLETVGLVLENMADVAYCSKFDLLRRGAGKFDLDDIHECIAWRHLHIDWDSAFRRHTDAVVFRDENALRAYGVSKRLGGPKPSQAFDVGLLRAGDVLALDGKQLTVQVKGDLKLHLTDQQNSGVQLRLMDVQRYYDAGELVPVSLHTWSDDTTLFAPPGAVEEALVKLQLVERVKSGAVDEALLGRAERTVRRWRSAVDEAINSGVDPVRALTDQSSKRGWRGSHLTSEKEAALKKFLLENLPDPQDRSAHSLYPSYKDAEVTRGETPVSYPTFLEAHKTRLNEVRGEQKGVREAYQESDFHEHLYFDTPVHGTHAFAVVHIDHTPLSQVLISFLNGAILGTPWLSLAICAFTRRVLAYYLSFHAPSARSLCCLFIEMVRRWGRAPSTVVFDGGSDFASNNWGRVMRRFRMDYLERTSKPRGGTLIERMFGTTEIQLAQQMPGNTKSRKRGRLNTALVDAASHAGMTLGDAYETYDEFFYDIYDNRQHPALLQSPHDFYDKSIARDGNRKGKFVRYDNAFLIETALDVDRAHRLVDRRRGVTHNRHTYLNKAVQTLPAIGGKKWRVREHLFDPAMIYVQCANVWQPFQCAQLSSPITGADTLTQRVLSEELYMLRKLHSQSEAEALRRLSRLIDNARALAARRRENVHQPEDDGLLASIPPAAPKATTLEGMFRAAREGISDDVEMSPLDP